MTRSWSTPFVESFEEAFSGMKVDYQSNPFIYLNKWDVVADLYSRMKEPFEPMEVQTGRYTVGRDGRWRQKRIEVDQAHTTPLHMSLGFDRSDRPRADICYIDTDSMQVSVTARFSAKNPTALSSWRFGSGAGISVFRNTEIQYAKRRNTQTGRYSKTENLKEMERDLLKNIADLKQWDKSILLLVDDHGLYTKNELEATFSKKLDPYTMKFYYLSPRSGYYITGHRRTREVI